MYSPEELRALAEEHPVTEYARRVVSGAFPGQVCKWEILACTRHLDDLKRSGTAEFPFVFDVTRANRIYKHFSLIPRLDVPEQHIELEDWQKFDLGCLMGWVHKDTGRRRFRLGYTRIARGHAKTTLAAGLANYFMLGDAMYPPGQPEYAQFEMQPQINIVAVDRAQGNIARGDIADMARATPAFLKRLSVKNTYIRHKVRGGSVEVFSRDTNNKDGGRPSLIITEEWHAHVNSKVHDVAVSGKGKKRQCLEYIITTAGADAENKPCYRDDCQYKQVLEGNLRQDDVFVMIREIDDDDDPHNKACWAKANPFFRSNGDYASALREEVESQYADAYGMNNENKIREFLIKRMNRWQADSQARYMSMQMMEKWRALAVPAEEFAALVHGRERYLGADLSKKIDLTATGSVWPLADGRFAVDAHGYLPEEGVTAHERSDRVPYRAWIRDGWATATPGSVTDYHAILEDVQRMDATACPVKEFDFDPYQATHLAQDLAAYWTDLYGDAAAQEMVVEIRQGVQTLSEPTKLFRELVMQGRIVHRGNPLLTWCLANSVEVSDDNGNIKLSKKNLMANMRIDAIAALLNAFVRASQRQEMDINAVIGAEDWGF